MLRSTAFGRFLLDNLVWLIGSFLLAIFVWIAAVNEQNPVEAHRYAERIPIDILIDEGMLVTNTPVSTAQLSLRTTADVWESLSLDAITITTDLTGKTPGTYTTPLTVEFQTSSRIIVESIQPEQITVDLAQGAEKLVPIKAEVRTPPPTGFEVLSTDFSTQEVLISGVASEVAQVTSANIRLHLGDETNTYTRNYRLFAVDDEGETIDNVVITPETVDVTVEIEPGADYREVFVVPNIIGEPAEGYVVVSITYNPQTILVSGRLNELERLPGTIQTTSVDLTGETDSTTRTVSVSLPEGVYLPTEQNITVTVEIDPLTANRRFDTLPVQIQGLGADLQAQIVPAEVEIIITGAQPVLDTLHRDDISIIVNLDELPTGNHQVPLEAVINREGLESAVISVLPPVLEVSIVDQVSPPADAINTPPQP